MTETATSDPNDTSASIAQDAVESVATVQAATRADGESASGGPDEASASDRAASEAASDTIEDAREEPQQPEEPQEPAELEGSAELQGSAEPEESAGPEDAPEASEGRKSSLRRLEEEGEVAADYLEELLDIADLDGDIDIDVENGRASVAIVEDEASQRTLKRLVGSQGEVLEALQDLARLAVQARTGDRSRLMLDVAGFRAGRKRVLEDVAARACQEVARTGEKVKLDPMSAFERKVVHDVVAEAGLVSESEGEDPGRRVVIHPAGD